MEWTYSSGGSADSILNTLVSETYGVEPSRVELVRRRGAPEVRIEGSRVEVSRSRSHGFVAAATVSPGEECFLGIDIEAVGPFLDSQTEASGFADVVLAPEEFVWFHKTAGRAAAERLTWLLRTWVRKEAVLKSLHTGFDVGRGGLPPADVVLNAPWDAPLCLSHDRVTLMDLPVHDHAGDHGSVMLALAQNTGAIIPPRR